MRTVWVSKYLAIFSNRTWYGFTIVIHRDSSLWCSSLSNQPKNVCFISWQILWPLHFCEVRTLRVTRTNHHCQRKQPQRSRTRTTSHQATFAMFAVFWSSFHGNGKSMRISYFLDYLHFIHYVPSTISIYEKGIIHYHITGVLQDVLAEEERCKQEADTEDAARYQELSHTYRLANTGSRPSVTRKRLKIVQKVEVKNGIPKKCINMYCCQCCQMSPITIFGIKWSCCPISGQTHKMFCSRRFRSCCHF